MNELHVGILRTVLTLDVYHDFTNNKSFILMACKALLDFNMCLCVTFTCGIIHFQIIIFNVRPYIGRTDKHIVLKYLREHVNSKIIVYLHCIVQLMY